MDERQLRTEADRIRRSGFLGRSARLLEAFEALVNASLEKRSLKEIELGAILFENDVRLEGSMDSAVRVLVFRLRKKLDEFYAIHGGPDGVRLDLPKGAYQLTIVPCVKAPTEPLRPAWSSIGRLWSDSAAARSAFMIGAALVLACGGFGIAKVVESLGDDQDVPSLLRHRQVWQQFVEGETLPIFVLGTLPALGENTAHIPTVPIAVTYGIRNLMPLLYLSRQRDRFPIIVSTDRLQPEMLRRNNLIYLGLVGNLGAQLDPGFDTARFVPVGNSQVLIDRATGRRYANDPGLAGAIATHTEYALLSSSNGPDGTRVIVLTGTGNAAVSQATSLAMNSQVLADIEQRTGGANNFEALFAVRANGSSHQGAKLLAAVVRQPSRWGAALR